MFSIINFEQFLPEAEFHPGRVYPISAPDGTMYYSQYIGKDDATYKRLFYVPFEAISDVQTQSFWSIVDQNGNGFTRIRIYPQVINDTRYAPELLASVNPPFTVSATPTNAYPTTGGNWAISLNVVRNGGTGAINVSIIAPVGYSGSTTIGPSPAVSGTLNITVADPTPDPSLLGPGDIIIVSEMAGVYTYHTLLITPR
jgi:hypothetical protein